MKKGVKNSAKSDQKRGGFEHQFLMHFSRVIRRIYEDFACIHDEKLVEKQQKNS
jgi:hypothetical protein